MAKTVLVVDDDPTQRRLMQAALEADTARPEFYRRDGQAIAAAMARLEEVRTEIERAYARWETLSRRT